MLGLDGAKLAATVEAFSVACRPGALQPQELDGLATERLDPPKTYWARPITEPPYYGHSLRTGVTFTYLGLKVDPEARATGPWGCHEDLLMAGEMMAGSILGQGYLAGFGLTIGTVFGRLAGQGAAAHDG